MLARFLHWASRIFLGGIFLYAGYTKLENPLQFAVAVEGYQLLSPKQVIWLIKIIPWLEMGLGSALLAGIYMRGTAAFAAGMVVFFIGLMLVTYLRGIDADCGCFGMGEKISQLTLVRDAFIILPALYLIIRPRVK